MFEQFEFDAEDDEQKILDATRQRFKDNEYFMEHGLPPVISYFFYQAYQALEYNLFLPACTSFLNGIETSLRITLKEYETKEIVTELNPRILLNNKLLSDAQEVGLPVHLLAFPGEDDFQAKIEKKPPNHTFAEIVRIRHNFCHGNILEYINSELEEVNHFFTPECTRDIAINLLNVSKLWVKGLGEFRKNHINTDRHPNSDAP
ncbi:hypothetical protein RCU70_11840 [Escherichia marmotae]|nr:hypothetical protein [Escherichia marmotae]